jgi:hypothetical protein
MLRPTTNLGRAITRISMTAFESVQLSNRDGSPFFAVPGNAGPRTMDYGKLFDQATYKNLTKDGVSVFAGTVDDPFWIDLGATFDTSQLSHLGTRYPWGPDHNTEDAGPYTQGQKLF